VKWAIKRNCTNFEKEKTFWGETPPRKHASLEAAANPEAERKPPYHIHVCIMNSWGRDFVIAAWWAISKSDEEAVDIYQLVEPIVIEWVQQVAAPYSCSCRMNILEVCWAHQNLGKLMRLGCTTSAPGQLLFLFVIILLLDLERSIGIIGEGSLSSWRSDRTVALALVRCRESLARLSNVWLWVNLQVGDCMLEPGGA
jgi:hypothetical protein